MIEMRWKKLDEWPLPDSGVPVVGIGTHPCVLQYRNQSEAAEFLKDDGTKVSLSMDGAWQAVEVDNE